MSPEFRRAVQTDASEIAALANVAYRGDASRQGWTTEADLLDGLRTTPQEIEQLIAAQNSFFLLGFEDNELVASIHIECLADAAHVGMFVVSPGLQGNGLGKALLAAAEQEALQLWPLREFVMHVITLRHELIAFYERRGYRRTGQLEAFPINPTMWTPKVTGLQLEVLEKQLPA